MAMTASIEVIAPELQNWLMSEEQRTIVSHKQGPLLVIAGPGSGKTRSITLLAMNLLLCGDAQPSEIVLCTYTEKAAYELQDRLTSIARAVGYAGDLSQMRVGTIHSICQQLTNEYLHHTFLGNNYETLDHFTQRLLIFEHLEDICVPNVLTLFKQRWGTPWIVAKKLQFLFDKITEELIFDSLKEQYFHLSGHLSRQNAFFYCLAHSYYGYQKMLARTNCVDFAHLEKGAYNLLTQPETFRRITQGIRYVLVDEYQDTNYIQVRILTLLASGREPHNLCVIGDEDQALYRFRGATVRNILEFDRTFPDCKQIHLTANYRSHSAIINTCNQWMNSFNWSNPQGSALRTEKAIRKIPGKQYHEYPAVLSIQHVDVVGEAEQFAELVFWLKQQGSISDYSQVALLLHSVRPYMSEAYIQALESKGIPAYCPRARTYFDQEEICLMVGCFAHILQYREGARGATIDESYFLTYITHCKKLLAEQCKAIRALEQQLLDIEEEIVSLADQPEIDNEPQLGDYFYRLLFAEPFLTLLRSEDKRHNLVIFSQLLKTFQKYYRYDIINENSLHHVRDNFFLRFLSLLYTDGVNQDDDWREPLPRGHVQIMTIHQAKGLEFPVVAVGRLDKLPPSSNDDDQDLKRFYHYPSFEPEQRITDFDRRRLYYVAFSRAEHLLVCSASKKPDPYFASLWDQAPSWPYVHSRMRNMPRYVQTKEYQPPKPRYGFTTHVQMYATCPRRYQFFHEYHFVPSGSVEAFFGLLIHQTIERIHRYAHDGSFDILEEQRVRGIFEKTYQFLLCSSMRPIDENRKEQAFRLVLHYVYSNQQEMRRIEETELSFRVEQDQYVLAGQIDLLLRGQNGLEVLDFKTAPRPENGSALLSFYQQQLYLYAYAIQKRRGQLPSRLLLYWMAEECKEDALMEIPCHEDDVQDTIRYLDNIATKIQQQQFTIITPPGPEICKMCDVRHLCKKEKIIEGEI